MIGDRDPVRVASEVFKDVVGASERRLGIDDPLETARSREQLTETRWPGQGIQLTMKMEVICAIRFVEQRQEFATEEPAQNAHGEKEARTRADPA
jgi:hypothetical protein